MHDGHPNPDLIALGIKQPWAELILRGIKSVEIRSQDTNVRGPVYLYTSKRIADIEPAEAAIEKFNLDVDSLPRGVIVGTVEIVDSQPCRQSDEQAGCVPSSFLTGNYAWHLDNPVPFREPLTVRFLPYGVWFYPFKRRARKRRQRRNRRGKPGVTPRDS